MIKLSGKYTAAYIMIDEVEPECLAQIEKMINHPVFTNRVVIMPDTHAGKGSVIGFTMPVSDFVIPNVIGVDIGCGMICVEIGNNLKEEPEIIDRKIQSVIPMGRDIHKRPVFSEFDYNAINERVFQFFKRYQKVYNAPFQVHEINKNWIEKKMNQIGIDKERFYNSIGTLGGGNHFIEIGRNSEKYFLTIHSGSRNFGLRIAEYWQERAVETQINELTENESSRSGGKREKKKMHFYEKELAFLSGIDMFNYLTDMVFAQYYAHLNRKKTLELILEKLHISYSGDIIESVHNYIDFHDFIIRKGALRSVSGEKLIIPFNMRDGIIICEGKDNAEWNYSAPHGAGRIMSRAKAKKLLSLEEYRKSMKGIYSTCIKKDTIDESPMVYKDPGLIEKLIEPVAKILFKIKPVLNIKSAE